ncbi:phosphofructokinase [Clostridium carboxidivorans P7]|uniref:Tagatose-6-phosphate kinase n=1 Tax=Clostridium carboxidivorans P7 TaxID=536227 RepID=C6PRZ3_9CLOT|nr:1-phosphofructokinase [Clostridium carboxidivorans]AKN30004.1 phosphofructokinase [Clostridium carboxidivorans P7]EET88045.1 1-phosphofructokinase [Clostridium carboxidivorans P7]EFG88998.1 1-phosphofructokinase [Clostridium carboxidivorans P7]
MIITVTLNPALDKTITLNGLSIGNVNRAITTRQDIGGKGINVSKVLKNFHVNSLCTGFLGGNLENVFIQDLKKRELSNEFIHIKNETRTNTKIVDSLSNTNTDINEPGPNISEYELEAFINKFKSICNKGDIVVLSGGVSPSLPDDIYLQLTKIAKAKEALVILDASGNLLEQGIKACPDIIKPNDHELQKLLNLSDVSDESIINAAKQLNSQGISKIMISLGEKGGVFVTKNGVYKCHGLKVPVKSTVGAGDSMVAAIVYSLLNNYGDEETLRFATACGAASVSLEGTQACTLEQVKKLLIDVKCEIKEEF